MKKSSTGFFAAVFILAVVMSGLNAHASSDGGGTCGRFLQISFNHKNFLRLFDQNAVEVKKITQSMFPEYLNGVGLVSNRNFDRLINIAVEDLAQNPFEFIDTIDRANKALGNKPITVQQEVGIFLASKSQTLLKFIILASVGFTNEESVALGATIYPEQFEIPQ
jgi:hypothetical protein